MLSVRQIYYRYIVISIVLINIIFSTELCYLALVHSFIGCYFEYLPLSPLDVCDVSLTGLNEFTAFWSGYFTFPEGIGTFNLWKGKVT